MGFTLARGGPASTAPPRAGRAPPPRAAAADGGPPRRREEEGRGEYTYKYTGTDGRKKATLEQAFAAARADAGLAADLAAAPWQLSYQASERGAGLWGDELKARLVTRLAAEELRLDDDEVGARLGRLTALLPDLAAKLPAMHPGLLARLVAQADAVPARLMAVKEVFPGANASLLATRAPWLVLGGADGGQLAAIAEQLRRLLPALDVDRLVEENPSMLDVEGFKAAVAEAARILPGADLQRAMAADPQAILSFQARGQLIEYDPPTPAPAAGDDEYSAYYKD